MVLIYNKVGKSLEATATVKVPVHPPPQKFEVMLAASEIPEPSQITFPILASVKYDGIRSAITNGVAMSRKMLPLPNVHLQAWVKRWASLLEGLDGEFIFGPPNQPTTFNQSTSGCNNADGGMGFVFYVFELWDQPALSAEARYTILQRRIADMPDALKARIVLVEQHAVSNWSQVEAMYDSALARGYEGLILKSPKRSYKNGRSTLNEGTLLKLKVFDTSEARILKVKQKQKNTNEKVRDEIGKAKRSSAKAGQVLVDAVGGFEVIDINPKSVHYNKTFTVGPGCLKHKELEDLWRNQRTERLEDKVLTYKFQRPPKGNTDKPRFPGFHGWPNLADTAL